MYINAITFYRIGRFFKERKIPLVPQFCSALIFILFNSSISIQSSIGNGTRAGHRGIGIVIHKDAVIGEHVLIRPHVVIGGDGRGNGAPVISDHVEIGAGAKILGSVRIGRNAIIGANAVVTRDVPVDAIVAGIPAEVIRQR